jgi:hypothetical protein
VGFSCDLGNRHSCCRGPRKGPRKQGRYSSSGMSATIFEVWAWAAGKMLRIDLVGEANRLDRDELFAVKAGLGLLQCDSEAPPSVQELATMLLIDLGRDNMLSKRVHRGPSR